MIGTVMPPKSPELAASVSEMELRVERTTWLSSTIMLGPAERMGAFTAAATHKSKPRVLCRVSASLSRGARDVGGACTHTHVYNALAVAHSPCEFTGELWEKGAVAAGGALTSTAHGAGLHHEAAGHGERAHDQKDDARHILPREEAVSDPAA